MLEDSDLVHLAGGDYQVYNAAELRGAGGGAPPTAVARALETLEIEVSQIMKVGGWGW